MLQARNIGKTRTFGDRQLRGHQIDARHFLRDGMLNLNARIDLHERHHAVRIDQKLNGSSAFVMRARADGHRRILECARGRGRKKRRRSLFDEFLVAPLQRAVARADGHDVSRAIAKHLNFDMAWPIQKTLDEAVSIAERQFGLMRGGYEGLAHILQPAHHLQAAAAPTVDGFDGQRQTMLFRECDDFGRIVNRFRSAGRHGRTHFGGNAPGLNLRAKHADGGWPRTDPRQTGIDDRLREIRVFGKKTIARMNGIGVRLARGFNDGRDVEIRAFRVGSAQRVGFIGGAHEQRVRIGVSIGGDGDAAGVMTGMNDTHGDFSAIGDENTAQFRLRKRKHS